MSKLTKLMNIFHKGHVKDVPKKTVKMRADFLALNQILPSVFPTNPKTWHNEVFFELDEVNKALLIRDNLPHHTRDNAWLARYMQHILADYHNNQDVDLRNAEMFVSTSLDFDKYRCQYEQSLIKTRIQELWDGSRSEAPIPVSYAAGRFDHDVNYDKIFRQTVLNDMTNLGIDQHSVEVGLETNAKLWREGAMHHTFKNRYYPNATEMSIGDFLRRGKHEDAWVKLREYQYYQEHKAVIDEVGCATNAMLITPYQVGVLTQINEKYHQKRQAVLAKNKPTVEREI